MQTCPTVLLGGILGSTKIILAITVVLILLGAGKLPRLARWLTKWLWGDDAEDLGRSFGGIYGKSTFQALTPDNKVAELYNPADRKDRKNHKRRKSILRIVFELWARIRNSLVGPTKRDV